MVFNAINDGAQCYKQWKPQGPPSTKQMRRSMQTQARKQGLILRRFKVASRQQLLAVKNRARTGHKTQGLGGLAHGFTACRQTHYDFRHSDAGNGYDPNELEGIQIGGVI